MWTQKCSSQLSTITRVLEILLQTQRRSLFAPITVAYTLYQNSNTNVNALPLIILHSLLASKNIWRETSEILSRKLRRRIYAIDARNHGSSLHTKEHTYQHMGEDLLKFMEDHQIPKALLFGHGMGGGTVIYFTLKYPESVARGVIVDLSPLFVPRGVNHMAKILLAMKYAIDPLQSDLVQGREQIEHNLKYVASYPELLEFLMSNLRIMEDGGTFYWTINTETLLENLKDIVNIMAHIRSMQPFHGPMLFLCDNHAKFITIDNWPPLNILFPNADLQWLNVTNLPHIHQSQRFFDAVIEFLDQEQE